MKIVIYLLVFFCFVQLATALNICELPLNVQEECILLTPTLVCSGEYNYEIFNNTGGTEQTGNLTVFDTNIYYFNISLSEGEYLVELCDGSTREIIVGGKQMSLSLVVGVIGLVFLMFYISINLNDQFKYLKLFFVLTGISLMTFIPFSLITLNNTANLLYKSFLTIFSIFWVMVLIYVIYLIFNSLNLLPKGKK